MPKILYSDTDTLSRIKKTQYRHQIPALALLALSFFASFILSSFNMRYPSLGLAIIAMCWYMYVGACFRFKQKIAVPPPDTLISPITGRVKSIKRSSELYQLKIAKSSIDLVEIRCPHESAVWDNNNLRVVVNEVPLIIRFDESRLVKFTEKPMLPGAIIGMMIGSGSLSLNLPQNLRTPLKQKEICEAGVTPLLELP